MRDSVVGWEHRRKWHAVCDWGLYFSGMKSDRLREGFENGEEDAATGSEEERGKVPLRRKAEGCWWVNKKNSTSKVSSRVALYDTCDTLVEESHPPAKNHVYRTSLEHNPIMLPLNTLIIQLEVHLNQHISNWNCYIQCGCWLLFCLTVAIDNGD